MNDETFGMDDYSTVVVDKAFDPLDLGPLCVGWVKDEDCEDTYLVAWTTNIVTSKTLKMRPDGCVCPECDATEHFALVTFVNPTCWCGWQMPKSWSQVDRTFDYEAWFYDVVRGRSTYVPGQLAGLAVDMWNDEAVLHNLKTFIIENINDPELLAATYPTIHQILYRHIESRIHDYRPVGTNDLLFAIKNFVACRGWQAVDEALAQLVLRYPFYTAECGYHVAERCTKLDLPFSNDTFEEAMKQDLEGRHVDVRIGTDRNDGAFLVHFLPEQLTSMDHVGGQKVDRVAYIDNGERVCITFDNDATFIVIAAQAGFHGEGFEVFVDDEPIGPFELWKLGIVSESQYELLWDIVRQRLDLDQERRERKQLKWLLEKYGGEDE